PLLGAAALTASWLASGRCAIGAALACVQPAGIDTERGPAEALPTIAGPELCEVLLEDGAMRNPMAAAMTATATATAATRPAPPAPLSERRGGVRFRGGAAEAATSGSRGVSGFQLGAGASISGASGTAASA